MRTVIITIENQSGLHARPAARIAVESQKFLSDVWLDYAGRSVDLKSVFSILKAGIRHGAVVTLHTEGEDEELAARRISAELKRFVKEHDD